jgi:hypothetical protein
MASGIVRMPDPFAPLRDAVKTKSRAARLTRRAARAQCSDAAREQQDQKNQDDDAAESISVVHVLALLAGRRATRVPHATTHRPHANWCWHAGLA